jgi:16S rRNA (adenine1518-N6/adenine1519-N6)-dimethyltransferase
MKPKKRLGQHFLTAPSYAKKIVASIPATAHDHVLEIGPGKGALSKFLCERFPTMHCVEYDADVIHDLALTLGEGQWTLHREDIRTFDFSRAGFPLHVVGNLPYSIGALIIKKTLLYADNILSSTFMVQREVAQRIVAKPGTRQNGFLTIFCQFFCDPKILFHVPPGAFFPKPKVDSSVVRMVLRKGSEQRLSADKWRDFFSFVDKGFNMRRKILVNALGREGGKNAYAELLRGLDIHPLVRAEDLDWEQWLQLYWKSCAA